MFAGITEVAWNFYTIYFGSLAMRKYEGQGDKGKENFLVAVHSRRE